MSRHSAGLPLPGTPGVAGMAGPLPTISPREKEPTGSLKYGLPITPGAYPFRKVVGQLPAIAYGSTNGKGFCGLEPNTAPPLNAFQEVFKFTSKRKVS